MTWRGGGCWATLVGPRTQMDQGCWAKDARLLGQGRNSATPAGPACFRSPQAVVEIISIVMLFPARNGWGQQGAAVRGRATAASTWTCRPRRDVHLAAEKSRSALFAQSHLFRLGSHYVQLEVGHAIRVCASTSEAQRRLRPRCSHRPSDIMI